MSTTTVRILRAAAVILALGSVTVAAQQAQAPQITFQDLRDGLKDPTRWLIYGGDYGSQRHSPLTQITPQNVQRLVLSGPSRPRRWGSSKRRRS
jgi:glucose dehydrogenase